MDKNSLIKNTVLNVASNYIKQDPKINDKLDATLNKKFEKVDSDENSYIELLKFNILFYKTLSRNIEPLIGKWINDKYIPNIDELESNLELITSKCRKYVNKAMKEDIKQLKVEDLRSFLAYDKMDVEERRRRLEKDYKVLNLYKDLLNILFRKMSLDREEFEALYDMDSVEVKRELKKEIIICVNKILTAPKSLEEANSSDDTDYEYTEDMALVSEEMMSKDVDSAEHSGLNDVEVTYLTKLGDLNSEEIGNYVDKEYRKILNLEKFKDEGNFGFGKDGIIDFVASSVILEFLNKKNKDLIEGAMRLVAVGEFGEKNFKEYIESIIKDETVINLEVWKEACKIIEKNHRDILDSLTSSKESALDKNINIDEYKFMVKNADKNKPFRDSFDLTEVLSTKDDSDNDKADEDTKVFEELELLKSMRRDEKIKPIKGERAAKHKVVDLSSEVEEEDSDHRGSDDIHVAGFEELAKFDREYDSENNKNEQFEDEIISEDVIINEKVSDDDFEDNEYDDEKKPSGGKKIRDAIIAIAVVAAVVVIYITTIGGNKTTNMAKNDSTEVKQSQSVQTGEDKAKLDADKKEKEAEAKKAKEMEALKDGEGDYYRVYAGSHKNEESAKQAQDIYKGKGIETKIVESNGFFKLDAGDFDDYNDAVEKTNELSKKAIDTYIAKYDKYYDYRIEKFEKSAKKMSKTEMEKEYENLKEELDAKSGAVYKEYAKNLDKIYEEIQ